MKSFAHRYTQIDTDDSGAESVSICVICGQEFLEMRMHEDLTYRIIGACFEVYNEKGCGFLEPVYQECLELELGIQDIPFRAQASLRLEYKGRVLKKTYEPDFVCLDGSSMPSY